MSHSSQAATTRRARSPPSRRSTRTPTTSRRRTRRRAASTSRMPRASSIAISRATASSSTRSRNFGRLNADAVRGDLEATGALADALIARAVPTRTGLTWEYLFPFGGGRAPWTSGMAQAAGAQAFSRVVERAGRPDLSGHSGPGLPGRAGPDPPAARRPVGPPLQLLLDGRAQRPAPDGALGWRVRDRFGRSGGRAPRRPAEVGCGRDAALVRHGRLVAVCARRRGGGAEVPHLRRVAARAAGSAGRPRSSGASTRPSSTPTSRSRPS